MEDASKTNSEELDSGAKENASARPAPKIQHINALAFALSALLAVIATILMANLLDANARSEEAHARYETCLAATVELMDASDHLTTQSQMYVLTGNERHLNGYLDEIQVAKRRDIALETLKNESGNSKAADELDDALHDSNELAQRELYAMRLTAEANGLSPLPELLQATELAPNVAALSNNGKSELAKEMLLGDEYNMKKDRIITGVDDCSAALMAELERNETDIQGVVDNLMIALFVIVILLVGIFGAAVVANYRLVMRPMRLHARNIRENEPLDKVGAFELRYVVDAYNQIYEENHRRTMLLKREAETDALTNLLNRGSYDKVLKHHGKDIALIIFDVDRFKDVNDTYGHNIGDSVLKKVAASIGFHFRTTDYVCRIGGDEFAVVMTEITPGMRDIIEAKLAQIAKDLRDTSDGLPETTLSVGIAFSNEVEPGTNIYHAADIALYEAKHRGRDTHAFYSDVVA